MDGLNAYASELDRALKRGTKFANFNKDMHHATVVICTAFHHAEKHIRLLSQKLDPELYAGPWFTEEVERFVDKGRLDVLVETDVSSDHPVMALATSRSGNVSVRRVRDDVSAGYPYNYMLVDDIGYRFEHDRESTEALVVFNDDSDDDLRGSLKQWFDNLFARSKPVGT